MTEEHNRTLVAALIAIAAGLISGVAILWLIVALYTP